MLTETLRKAIRDEFTLSYRLIRHAPERDVDHQLFMLAHEDEIERLIQELLHKVRVMAYIHIKEQNK